MSLCFARCTGIAAALIGMAISLAAAASAGVQTPPPTAATTPPNASPTVATPGSLPAATSQPTAEGIQTKPSETFGKDITLTAMPIVYVKGSGTWGSAFATIRNSLKEVETYVAQQGLKASGPPMAIFLATDDRGFDYEAAIPVTQPPKDPPQGEIAVGQSPDGHALEFVHRGSYASLDDTYEAITNYLDERQLQSKNVLIEQYATDPVSADEKNLVVNVFVLIN
jgi:effector-binding domain-containing protein